jgi:hypothetical protein
MSAGLTGGVGAFVEWRRVVAVLAIAAPPLLALPLFVSEFTAHVLAISAYYVILAARGTCWPVLPANSRSLSTRLPR